MMPTNINHFTHKIMNDTPIPRTDEWETYCDECYYHLWRVRRKNERGFNDGYHVHNGNEARALVDLLNKNDSELAAVTEQRDTVTLRLGRTQEKMFDAERQRDRLAEALESIVGESAYEGLPELKQLAIEEALQSITNQNEL